MADPANDKAQRTPADKERSRQQSRTVSGKEAARGMRGGRQGSGRDDRRPQRAGAPAQAGRGAQQRRAAQQARTGTARQPARKPAAGRNRPRGAPARSRTALYTWAAVGLVVVVVGVFLAINLGSGKTKRTQVTPEPVPASILAEVTHMKPSVLDAVGTGAAAGVRAPTVKSGQPPLTIDGKPGIFFMGGEFCPFCAAERWAIIASLARFGSFSGLKTMASASTDAYPGTQTFTFATATYTSKYVGATLLETFGQNKTGKHTILKRPNKTESKLVSKYDNPTSPTSSGSIPFMDIGNKLIVSSASYTPQLLQGLSRAQIAADLSHATNPVAQAVGGMSNYISAGICSIAKTAPSSVCASSGVQAAAKALGISA